MNYTSKEQSEKLVELGLDQSTADMFYTSLDDYKTPWVWVSKPGMHPNDIPCWSIGALIELTPIINGETAVAGKAFPEKYVCSYRSNPNIQFGDTLNDAVYNMIVWLLQNNYIKKG